MIHICISTSKETTSGNFWDYNPWIILHHNLWIMTIIHGLLFTYNRTRSFKPHVVLCETKDHLPTKVTPDILEKIRNGPKFTVVGGFFFWFSKEMYSEVTVETREMH